MDGLRNISAWKLRRTAQGLALILAISRPRYRRQVTFQWWGLSDFSAGISSRNFGEIVSAVNLTATRYSPLT